MFRVLFNDEACKFSQTIDANGPSANRSAEIAISCVRQKKSLNACGDGGSGAGLTVLNGERGRRVASGALKSQQVWFRIGFALVDVIATNHNIDRI
jgi:hypothetical protein